jgi:hypothetical protein
VAVKVDGEPEHTVAGERAIVGAGNGLTVTLLVRAAQEVALIGVGVTTYCTVPAVEVLGLLSTWLIVLPLPALAPVIPPVIVPTVHVYVLGITDVRAILVFSPLHIAIGRFEIIGACVT